MPVTEVTLAGVEPNVGSVNDTETTAELSGFGCGFVKVSELGGKGAVHISKPADGEVGAASEYTAVIAIVYFVPGVRPAIVIGLAVPVAAVEAIPVPPRGAEAVYVYPVMVLVPHASGGVNAMDAPVPAAFVVMPVIIAIGATTILRMRWLLASAR